MIKKEYVELSPPSTNIKAEPVELLVDYNIKIEPLDQEEGSLVIDTKDAHEDDNVVNDEQLLLEWHLETSEQKNDTEESEESELGSMKVNPIDYTSQEKDDSTAHPKVISV